jgi:hypothetical protein
MSFSKTVSVCAALASIFAAGAAGWKLANENQTPQDVTPQLEEKVQQLEKQLEEAKQPQVVPQPVVLPTPTPQLPQTSQTLPPQLPPPPPVPENVSP